MKKYIQIIFQNVSSEQSDLLLAQLSSIGFEGFEEEENTLKAFIPSDGFDEILLNEITSTKNISFTKSELEETNWNAVWESNFQPVMVDDFVGIKADFHAPITGVKNEIIITPKMSFGTGHHATTYMMIQQMREMIFLNTSVFDFGTGTGILAILAEKLGAKEIKAIDNDDWSVTNAAENIALNNCRNIFLEKTESPTAEKKYDIILANINKNIILDNFSRLVDILAPNGILLLSGLLDEDENEIIQKAHSLYLQPGQKLTKDKWICLRFSH